MKAMKRNYNFDNEELNRDIFDINMDTSWTEDMDIDDSFCDEKVNQWLMEDFDQEDGLI
jgi:hypothetical protein